MSISAKGGTRSGRRQYVRDGCPSCDEDTPYVRWTKLEDHLTPPHVLCLERAPLTMEEEEEEEEASSSAHYPY